MCCTRRVLTCLVRLCRGQQEAAQAPDQVHEGVLCPPGHFVPPCPAQGSLQRGACPGEMQLGGICLPLSWQVSDCRAVRTTRPCGVCLWPDRCQVTVVVCTTPSWSVCLWAGRCQLELLVSDTGRHLCIHMLDAQMLSASKECSAAHLDAFQVLCIAPCTGFQWDFPWQVAVAAQLVRSHRDHDAIEACTQPVVDSMRQHTLAWRRELLQGQQGEALSPWLQSSMRPAFHHRLPEAARTALAAGAASCKHKRCADRRAACTCAV